MTLDWTQPALQWSLIAVVVIMLALMVFIMIYVRQLLYAQHRHAAQKQPEEELFIARMRELFDEKHLSLVQSTEAGQTRAQQLVSQILQDSLKQTSVSLQNQFAHLSKATDEKMSQLADKMDTRLHSGFEQSQKVFADVLKRLALIDQAQEKISRLSENVVSLQDILNDKRSRGAFGEVQLNHLVKQLMPPNSYEFQAAIGSNRVDCLIHLPDAIGSIAVDAKFPLENYQKMVGANANTEKPFLAAFKQDVKKHINDIHNKYIMSGTTAEGAVMFLPSEAIFAEIHARHADLVAYSQQQKVWLVSPTTMMALLTTIASVLKDVETRKQLHLIQQHLAGLAKDFQRFEIRFEKLATHIRLAHEDTEQVKVSAKKIASRFSKIEQVDLDEPEKIG